MLFPNPVGPMTMTIPDDSPILAAAEGKLRAEYEDSDDKRNLRRFPRPQEGLHNSIDQALPGTSEDSQGHS